MQQDVWKFLHLHIHTQHGKTATFTMHLKMQGQPLSGVEGAYKALKRKGKLQDTNYKFITFGGDGGTYDIGLPVSYPGQWSVIRILYMCATITELI